MQPANGPRSALPPLLAYLAALFIGGALLAPLLFDLGKATQQFLLDSPSLRDTGLTKLNEDIVVPRSKLVDLVNFAR